jgi:hypothetical protein
VEVIVEKTEGFPFPPSPVVILPVPPPPTVIGKVVAVTVMPVVDANGEAVCGEAFIGDLASLKPPAPAPPPPAPPPPATTK